MRPLLDVARDLSGSDLATARIFSEPEHALPGGQLELAQKGVVGSTDVWTSRFPVRAADGTIVGVSSMRTEVTDLKRAEARLAELLASEQQARADVEDARRILDERNRELAEQARIDSLTRLANRPAFFEHAEEALARARKAGSTVAVVYVDLDNFKQINDTLGHAAGDELLRLVAQRLHSLARATDLVARLGGDEFLVLIKDLDREQGATQAVAVADRARDLFTIPFAVGDAIVRVTASVGVGMSPADAFDADALVAAADAAMYSAKRTLRRRATAFGPVAPGRVAGILAGAKPERGESDSIYLLPNSRSSHSVQETATSPRSANRSDQRSPGSGRRPHSVQLTSASASVRGESTIHSGRMALVVARKAVIRDLIPGRPRVYEGVELRPDPGLAVERAEADRDFFALRPLPAEQTRAADRAEGFHASAIGPEDADQLLTGEQAEPFARDASLRSAEGARVLPAPRAVAVIGPSERRRHLEADTAAEARAVERVLGAWLCSHSAIGAESDVPRSISAFCPFDPCYSPRSGRYEGFATSPATSTSNPSPLPRARSA